MKTKFGRAVSFGIVSCFLAGSVFARSEAVAIRSGIEQLQSRATDTVRTSWYQGGDRVRSLRGPLSGPSSLDPDAAAHSFLNENAAIFGMLSGGADLAVTAVTKSPAGHHVRLEQRFGDLPVFNGGFEVHLGNLNEVYLVHNYYVPDLELAFPGVNSVSETMTEQAVVETAKQHFTENYLFGVNLAGDVEPVGNGNLPLQVSENDLGIFFGDRTPYLVRRLIVKTDSPPVGVAEYFVDTASGRVVYWRSLVQHDKRDAKVFIPNPINKTGGKKLLLDDNDTNKRFKGTYDTKKVQAVKKLITKGPMTGKKRFFLNSPYADVQDNKEAPVNYDNFDYRAPANKKGKFSYKRGANGFEHNMTSFWVHKNQKYIQSLGFDFANNRKMLVDPHGLEQNGQQVDNAHYVGDPIGRGYMAFGDGGVDLAEDADIILHEYGHALQDNQSFGKYSQNCNSDNEAAAMGEGFSDYWAASATYAESVKNGFPAACIGEWEEEYACLRKVDTKKKNPTDLSGECHANGEIWSSALWMTAKKIGKTNRTRGLRRTDILALESHTLVPANPTFKDGADAMIEADKLIFSNKHTGKICKAMRAHGIEPERCPIKCDNLRKAGGDTPETIDVKLGEEAGDFEFRYQTYFQEDRMLVKYEGQTLFDTGCVGTNGYLSKIISFSGDSTIVTVEVIPNCFGGSGTAWEFEVRCPQ